MNVSIPLTDTVLTPFWDWPGFARQHAPRSADDAIRFWLQAARNDGLRIPPPRGRSVSA